MRKRLRSFYYATKGILLAAKEPNFQIQIAVSALVVALGIWLDVNRWEWAILVVCIVIVLSAEMLNTAIETLTDARFPEQDDRAARIKDLAAGAVWILAIGSVVVGVLILGPKLWARF